MAEAHRPARPDNWSRVYSRTIRAEKDFSQLEAGDRILVGISGGSDSLVLLDILAWQQAKLGRSLGISLVAGHVTGSQIGRPAASRMKLKKVCQGLGLPLALTAKPLPAEIFTDCFKCSLARRRSLFDLAEQHGCKKIALGHNADDLVETALLNMFYSGKLAAITPRQSLLAGKLQVIRPLAYVWKEDIESYCTQRFGAARPLPCPGGRDSRRMEIRRMLKRMQSGGSPVKENLLKAISNPKWEYLPLAIRTQN